MKSELIMFCALSDGRLKNYISDFKVFITRIRALRDFSCLRFKNTVTITQAT